MDMLANFALPFMDLDLFFLVGVGTFAGIYVGAIPGLSVTMATALLLSVTYSWDMLDALALIMGVYVGGVYGGSRSAMLLNIPGAPASVATTFDGYPMSKLGEAGLGIGLATTMSFVGGIVGVFFLVFFTPLIADFALKFDHRDYFLLALMGLLLIGTLSRGGFRQSIFIAFLGVIIGLVGLDPITASPRFTFGTLALSQGINIVVAILGLFGFSEVLLQLSELRLASPVAQVGRTVPERKLILRLLPLSLRTSVIGVFIGALPGVGGEIAALLGYDHAKRTVKNPSRPFGEGAYEGVAAPESANNAAIGGALIPMLTLGIPGDAVTAVIIGSLVIHGLNPGPTLMINTPELFYVVAGSVLLANFFLLVFGFSGIQVFKKMVSVPKAYLLPAVTLLTIIGAYAINNNVTDIFWAFGFGIIGFVLRLNGIAVAPMVLGIILGPLLDESLRATLIADNSQLDVFLLGFVTSPISLVLSFVILMALASNIGVFKLFARART
ncbi:MAG: tripartite tricarboxylate transporter permease [Rhodospirillales bacterium]|nr:tripartite tricarboxylate transporter permease [Rhodospirillales bacterium]